MAISKLFFISKSNLIIHRFDWDGVVRSDSSLILNQYIYAIGQSRSTFPEFYESYAYTFLFCLKGVGFIPDDL